MGCPNTLVSGCPQCIMQCKFFSIARCKICINYILQCLVHFAFKLALFHTLPQNKAVWWADVTHAVLSVLYTTHDATC